jgi:sulfur-oxidizing protein SoxY
MWASKRRCSVSSIIALAAMLLCPGLSISSAGAAEDDAPWPDLAKALFHDAQLKDGADILTLDAPTRAEDAAIVPMTIGINLPLGDRRKLLALTLLIDQNPSPLVGVFKVGPNSILTSLSTKVRVDSYTNVHVVAELSDGGLYVTKRFVKASGGCSAPALKDAKEAQATMGQMKLRQFAKRENAAPDEHEVQVMIRHPNNSGMQMDQLSRLYIPPLFVEHLNFWQGDELVLSMEGGISISEDPSLRFVYRPASTADFRVEAIDSNKHDFTAKFPYERPQT